MEPMIGGGRKRGVGRGSNRLTCRRACIIRVVVTGCLAEERFLPCTGISKTTDARIRTPTGRRRRVAIHSAPDQRRRCLKNLPFGPAAVFFFSAFAAALLCSVLRAPWTFA